jgi:hypothetical protein
LTYVGRLFVGALFRFIAPGVLTDPERAAAACPVFELRAD